MQVIFLTAVFHQCHLPDGFQHGVHVVDPHIRDPVNVNLSIQHEALEILVADQLRQQPVVELARFQYINRSITQMQLMQSCVCLLYTSFGLLIRKIAKLDHEAAMQAFSAFINDQSLNQKQIAFVNKIINHIELNGYMENVAELTKPPFDKPISFIKLFDAKTRTALMETINQVRENAVQITAS